MLDFVFNIINVVVRVFFSTALGVIVAAYAVTGVEAHVGILSPKMRIIVIVLGAVSAGILGIFFLEITIRMR